MSREDIEKAGASGEKAGIWIAIKMQMARVQLEKELGRPPTPDELAERIMEERSGAIQ